MSEYLGWQERKPAREFDPTRLHRDAIPSGPVTHGYEDFVRGIFHPGKAPSPEETYNNNVANRFANMSSLTRGEDNASKATSVYASPLDVLTPQKISASRMLKMEQELGKHAIDDSNDDVLIDKSPLEQIYDELGSNGITQERYNAYQVYKPKSSVEYFNTLHNITPTPNLEKGLYSSFSNDRVDDKSNWRKTDRQFLIDYKDFESSPLSPYMYWEHPYVRRQDSRIVGSNFVQLTTRPKDRFIEKIEKTLADVRAMPRY